MEAVPRPPSPSPGSPIAAQLNALTNVIEEDEGVDTEAEEIEAVQDLLVKPEPIPSRSERNELLNENLLVRHISQSNPKQVKDRATGIRRVGFLKDVTNGNSVDWSTISSPPPSSSSPPQSLSSLISPTPAPSTPATTPLTSPTDMKAASIASSSFETPSVPPALSVCSADEMSDDPFGQAGRERRSRSRKSVNYAEPSLKVYVLHLLSYNRHNFLMTVLEKCGNHLQNLVVARPCLPRSVNGHLSLMAKQQTEKQVLRVMRKQITMVIWIIAPLTLSAVLVGGEVQRYLPLRNHWKKAGAIAFQCKDFSCGVQQVSGHFS